MRKRAVIVFAAALITSAALDAQDHEHIHGPISPSDPPIKITINPEARVSVALAGALPPAAACGTAVDLGVKIINQGFVTSRLEAELVGDNHNDVTIDFQWTPLKGIPEEQRNLRITLRNTGSTDLSISFTTHNNTPDLAGRDRIHFLMHCL